MALDLESKQLQLNMDLLNLQKKYQALYLSKLEQKTDAPAVEQPHSVSGKRPRPVKTVEATNEDPQNQSETITDAEPPSSKRLRIEAEAFIPEIEQSEPLSVPQIEKQQMLPAIPDSIGQSQEDIIEDEEDEQGDLDLIDEENEDDVEPFEEEIENQAFVDEIMYAPDVTDEDMETLKGLIPFSGNNLI